MVRRQAYFICVENPQCSPDEVIAEIMHVHEKQEMEKYAFRFLEKECHKQIRMVLKCKKQYGFKRIERCLQKRGFDVKFTDFDVLRGYHMCFEEMELTPDGFEEATYCASPGHPARADSIIRTNEIAAFHREEEQDERRRRRRVDRNRRLRVKEHRKLLRRDAVWRAMWDGVPLDEHFFEQFPDCRY